MPALMPVAEVLSRKFDTLARVLDERTRRLVAAAEAAAVGYGGVTVVAQAGGWSRGTVTRGLAELKAASKLERGRRIRRKGAGRKRTVDQDATLKRDLETLAEPVTRGYPETPLRWTCKSVRQLAAELQRMGRRISHRMVAELLHPMDYSPAAIETAEEFGKRLHGEAWKRGWSRAEKKVVLGDGWGR